MDVLELRQRLNIEQRNRIEKISGRDFRELSDRELVNACRDASCNYRMMDEHNCIYIEALGKMPDRILDRSIHELYKKAGGLRGYGRI